jgi:cytochrome c oxidase subunit 1
MTPPPNYNFLHAPVVESRHPLWDTTVDLPVLTGFRDDRREILVTTAFDARPDSRHEGPTASIWPLYLALCMGVVFIGSIFSPWFVPGGIALSLLGLAGWGWTGSKRSGHERVATPAAVPEHA